MSYGGEGRVPMALGLSGFLSAAGNCTRNCGGNSLNWGGLWLKPTA